MNRETIEKAANVEMLSYYADEIYSSVIKDIQSNFIETFKKGAEWRINSVWHDNSIRPGEDCDVLVETKRGIEMDRYDIDYNELDNGTDWESDRRNNIDSYDTYHFDSYSLMWTSGKFYIPEKLKEKLRIMIAYQTKNLMEKSFGENLLHINNVINLERRRERQIKRYSLFALTGWIVGTLVIAIAALF